MLYNSESKNAVLAMEYAKTDGYGDYFGGRRVFSCPCCGALEPEVFFVNYDEECVGCGECVSAAETPWG